MIFYQIFYTSDGSRLRAGWRLAVQTVVMLILMILLSIPAYLLVFILNPTIRTSELPLSPEYLLLGTIGESIAITISVFLARRFLDKQPIESLGLRLNLQALLDTLAGIGISLVQTGSIYFLMLGLGWLTFEGFAWDFDPIGAVIGGVLIFLVIFVFTGWNEELLSRGYHLQTIASGTNLFWGVILSSTVFGLIHLRNPNATWLSAAVIFFAGTYLAYGYIRTGQLWLSIGLHIGWNFFEGVVFGFPVSGLDIYALTRIKVQGPEIWTGGAFGPEGGLIVLPSLLVGVGLIYLYTRKRTT